MAGHKGVIVVRKTKTRKTFLVFTSISKMHQEHVPISFSRDQNLIFLSAYLKMLHQKSVKAALQVYLSKCVPGL